MDESLNDATAFDAPSSDLTDNEEDLRTGQDFDHDGLLESDLPEFGSLTTDDDTGQIAALETEGVGAFARTPEVGDTGLHSDLDRIVQAYRDTATQRYERGLAVGMHWASKLSAACDDRAAMQAEATAVLPAEYAAAQRRAADAQATLKAATAETEAREAEVAAASDALQAEEAALATRRAEYTAAQDKLQALQDALHAQMKEAADIKALLLAEKAETAQQVRDLQRNIKMLHAKADGWAVLLAGRGQASQHKEPATGQEPRVKGRSARSVRNKLDKHHEGQGVGSES